MDGRGSIGGFTFGYGCNKTEAREEKVIRLFICKETEGPDWRNRGIKVDRERISKGTRREAG